MIAGIVSAPSSFMAFTRVWPLMMTLSLFRMIAPMNPYRLIEATSAGTAWSFSLGLCGYGVISASFTLTISMFCLSFLSVSHGTHATRQSHGISL